LGQFLIENCFQLRVNTTTTTSSGHRNASATASANKESLLDHTLSFSHRNGRLEIRVKKITDNNMIIPVASFMNSNSSYANSNINAANHPNMVLSYDETNPMNFPITTYSYCKECGKVCTPVTIMSEESWKMSFGKFMEMSFYNRSALGRTGAWLMISSSTNKCVARLI
jgi:hypothetical protein